MAVCVVAALGLSACGGGATADGADRTGGGVGDAGTDDRRVAVLASELGGDGSPFSDDDATCLAAALVDVLPTDADLAAVDGPVIGDAVLGCGISIGELVAEAMGGEVDRALVACLDEHFTADAIGQLLSAGTTGDSVGDHASADVAMDAALACARHLPDSNGDNG